MKISAVTPISGAARDRTPKSPANDERNTPAHDKSHSTSSNFVRLLNDPAMLLNNLFTFILFISFSVIFTHEYFHKKSTRFIHLQRPNDV